MTQSHRSLVRSFEDGATSGKSSSMEIVQHNDYTLLVGYGHAIYAVRTPEAKIVRFDGWAFKSVSGSGWRDSRGYAGSMTTKTSHFPAMRSVGDVCVAYSSPSTDMEQRLHERADVKTGDEAVAAPQLSDDWLGGAVYTVLD